MIAGITVYQEYDEATLVEKARKGDQFAFKRLYEMNFDRIYLLIARITGGEVDIEDAVQDTFLIAHKKLAEFEGRSTFATYIYRIALLVAKSYRYRGLLKLLRTESTPIEDLPLKSMTPTPSEYLDTKAAEEKVRRILAKMPLKKREILVLFELEGNSGQEIAELLGIPLPTVWTRLHYAREEFARLLRQEEAMGTSGKTKRGLL